MAMRDSPSAAAAPRVEQSLKTAIQINPQFAPAYAMLASLYARRGENLSQAHALALQAVALDPTNVQFYMVTATVLLRMEDPSNAVRVCQKARSLAKTPAELSAVTMELGAAERYQSLLEQQKQEQQAILAANKGAGQSTARSAATFQAAEVRPPVLMRRPGEHGPRDESNGVIKSVTCSSPASLDMVFETGHRILRLHTDNYFQVVYDAINFTPHGELNPCTHITGMKARAVFYDVEGHPDEGDLISLGLKK
jgi:tetratricopeptide (TPR) repeat protein